MTGELDAGAAGVAEGEAGLVTTGGKPPWVVAGADSAAGAPSVTRLPELGFSTGGGAGVSMAAGNSGLSSKA